MRNSERSAIGACVWRSWKPTAWRYPSRPCRATAATAPAIRCSLTYRFSKSVASLRRAEERPTVSGLTRGGAGCCAPTLTMSTAATKTNGAAARFLTMCQILAAFVFASTIVSSVTSRSIQADTTEADMTKSLARFGRSLFVTAMTVSVVAFSALVVAQQRGRAPQSTIGPAAIREAQQTIDKAAVARGFIVSDAAKEALAKEAV